MGDPLVVVSEDSPDEIRIRTRAADEIALRDPVVAGDTIRGEGQFGSVDVAAADVVELRVLRFSAARTLVAGGVAFIGSVIAQRWLVGLPRR